MIIIDCDYRPDLYDLIMLHSRSTPGDVISTWAKTIFKSEYVYLLLEFQKPTPNKVMIPLSLRKNLELIDGIIRAHALYLQPSQGGNRTNVEIDTENILIEIPCTGLPFDWEKIYKKSLIKKYKKQGFSTNKANQAATSHITESRFVWDMRGRQNK